MAIIESRGTTIRNLGFIRVKGIAMAVTDEGRTNGFYGIVGRSYDWGRLRNLQLRHGNTKLESYEARITDH